jgi:hypothetical protein
MIVSFEPFGLPSMIVQNRNGVKGIIEIASNLIAMLCAG